MSSSHDWGEVILSASTRTGTLLTSNTGSANVNTALNAPRNASSGIRAMLNKL